MHENEGKRITIETERVLVIALHRSATGEPGDGSNEVEVLRAEAATRLLAMDQLQPPGRGKLPLGPRRYFASCLNSVLRLFRAGGTARLERPTRRRY